MRSATRAQRRQSGWARRCFEFRRPTKAINPRRLDQATNPKTLTPDRAASIAQNVPVARIQAMRKVCVQVRPRCWLKRQRHAGRSGKPTVARALILAVLIEIL